MQLLREPVKAQEERGKLGCEQRAGSVLNKSLGCALYSVQCHSGLWICLVPMKMQSVCHQTHFNNTNESPLLCNH